MRRLNEGITMRNGLVVVLMCFATTFAWSAAPHATSKKSPPSTGPANFSASTARYEAALTAARETYLRELTDALKAAMSSDNLEESNRIDAAIKSINQEQRAAAARRQLANRRPGERGMTVLVKANAEWQPATRVRKGDVLILSATGTWVVNNAIPATATYGPDGRRPDGTTEVHAQWGLLMARIGTHLYLVGSGATIAAPQDGLLELRVNDFNLTDNQGAINVSLVRG
jgi:hypothetical protein